MLGGGWGEPTKLGDTRKNVNVSVHDGNRHPEIVVREDDLLVDVSLLINGKLHHAQSRPLSRRVILPVKVGL